jgi:hypothetical protein
LRVASCDTGTRAVLPYDMNEEVTLPHQIDRGPADDEDPVKVSEGLGGVTGGTLGVGLGALLGPAGMIVGGLAGAVGGWWAGRGLAQAGDDFSDETDAHYRSLHDSHHADRCEFEDARGFYRLGRLARSNPDYEGRQFDDIEPELRRGWRDEGAGRFRSWDEVRPFVQTGYDQPPR